MSRGPRGLSLGAGWQGVQLVDKGDRSPCGEKAPACAFSCGWVPTCTKATSRLLSELHLQGMGLWVAGCSVYPNSRGGERSWPRGSVGTVGRGH